MQRRAAHQQAAFVELKILLFTIIIVTYTHSAETSIASSVVLQIERCCRWRVSLLFIAGFICNTAFRNRVLSMRLLHTFVSPWT